MADATIFTEVVVRGSRRVYWCDICHETQVVINNDKKVYRDKDGRIVCAWCASPDCDIPPELANC